MKTLQLKIKIITNRRVIGDYYKIVLEAGRIAKAAMPGQFVSIKIDGGEQTFLRRPFSIHRVEGRRSKVEGRSRKVKSAIIELLYEIKGRGTQILSQKKAGEYLDIIGPLGNGFNYLPPSTSHLPPILVAGGMGVAPLIFLAEKLARSSEPGARSKIVVLLGARNKNDILCKDELKKLGCKVKIATDDGSKGFKGKVTDLLCSLPEFCRSQLPAPSSQRSTIYACGPRPMLRQISRIALKHNIPAQISLEEHMSCGIGACMGCVVDTRQGYKRVCKEGPVFGANEIIWR